MKGSLRLNAIRRRRLARLVGGLAVLAAVLALAQTAVAHRPGSFFTPEYEKINLSPALKKAALDETDYELLFLQTGLGRSAVDRLLSAGEVGKAIMFEIQEQFFTPGQVDCTSMLGLFTREDRRKDSNGQPVCAPYLVDWRPGDILVTLSTHSFGWRHGHAALVVETAEGLSTLECAVLGEDSRFLDAGYWRFYSSYAVLRVKGKSDEARAACAQYAANHLVGIPYHLTAGLIGNKFQNADSRWFGLQCAYLPWYAWKTMGVDLDSDGGRLVSVNDLLHSDQVEIVQLFGMDPREWV